MLCFRDMTYCIADCMNTDCFQHRLSEKKDRERIESDLLTSWADLSPNCEKFMPYPADYPERK